METYYLDANSSSKLRPEVVSFVYSWLESSPLKGNPSSIHRVGRELKRKLEESRMAVLDFFDLNSKEAEVVFTSGGTEGCNLMLQSFFAIKTTSFSEIVYTALDHDAVLSVIEKNFSDKQLKKIPLTSNGIVASFEEFITPNTEFLSIPLCNGEIGSIQPIAEISRFLKKTARQSVFVSDLSQAISKSKFSLRELFSSGLDAVCFSGQKLGSLPGVGVVIYNKCSSVCRVIEPLITGGPQENGLRAGTENVLAISSLSLVLLNLKRTLSSGIEAITDLRELLSSKILTSLRGVYRLTPERQFSNSNTLLLRVDGCRSDDLVVALDLEGVCCSIGSACRSGKQSPSLLLPSIGLDEIERKQTIRFSLDWDCSKEIVLNSADIFSKVVNRVR